MLKYVGLGSLGVLAFRHVCIEALAICQLQFTFSYPGLVPTEVSSGVSTLVNCDPRHLSTYFSNFVEAVCLVTSFL